MLTSGCLSFVWLLPLTSVWPQASSLTFLSLHDLTRMQRIFTSIIRGRSEDRTLLLLISIVLEFLIYKHLKSVSLCPHLDTLLFRLGSGKIPLLLSLLVTCGRASWFISDILHKFPELPLDQTLNLNLILLSWGERGSEHSQISGLELCKLHGCFDLFFILQ